MSVTLVVEHGIERFAEPDLIGGVEPVEIAGFPGVRSPPPPSMPDNCLVAVDVHPGQMVGVLLADGGNDPPVAVDQLCREIPRFAGTAMSTLVSR